MEWCKTKFNRFVDLLNEPLMHKISPLICVGFHLIVSLPPWYIQMMIFVTLSSLMLFVRRRHLRCNQESEPSDSTEEISESLDIMSSEEDEWTDIRESVQSFLKPTWPTFYEAIAQKLFDSKVVPWLQKQGLNYLIQEFGPQMEIELAGSQPRFLKLLRNQNWTKFDIELQYETTYATVLGTFTQVKPIRRLIIHGFQMKDFRVLVSVHENGWRMVLPSPPVLQWDISYQLKQRDGFNTKLYQRLGSTEDEILVSDEMKAENEKLLKAANSFLATMTWPNIVYVKDSSFFDGDEIEVSFEKEKDRPVKSVIVCIESLNIEKGFEKKDPFQRACPCLKIDKPHTMDLTFAIEIGPRTITRQTFLGLEDEADLNIEAKLPFDLDIYKEATLRITNVTCDTVLGWVIIDLTRVNKTTSYPVVAREIPENKTFFMNVVIYIENI